MSYIKVYGRKKNGGGGDAVFFKDGYTDLRGRFNYAELSGCSDAQSFTKFAIFVFHEGNGSVIKEAKNPRVAN